MATITHIDITDDALVIYVPTKELPDTPYVNQQWLQVINEGYKEDIVKLIAFVHKERELPISFLCTDYCDLAEHLKEHFTYNLSQARRIIHWIEDNVVQPSNKDCDWGTVYLEILEGARGC